MYEGWLALAGTELVNNERATVYAEKLGIHGVGCSPCPDFHLSVGDAEYTNPAADDAPWYDPRYPASERFAGFIGMAVDGMGGTGVRTPIDLRDGALIGGLRRAQREIGVTALAVAADAQALSYGMAWLASALRGAVCMSCRGDFACCFAACPTGDGSADVRTLVDVGLLDGPTVSDRERLGATCAGGDGMIATVEYTLVAGLPYFYHEPVSVDFPPLTAVSGIVDPPAACPGDVGECTPDPACTAIPARPAAPVPTNPCECTFTAGKGATIQVPAAYLGRWTETVPVLTIYTGPTTDLKCMRVRFYRNPRDLACLAVGAKDPCDFCDEFGISFVPKGSSLIVDGRNRTVTLDCSATKGAAPQGPYLYASPGRAFAWPTFDCPGGMCVEFMAAQIDPAARITLALVAREDAA